MKKSDEEISRLKIANIYRFDKPFYLIIKSDNQSIYIIKCVLSGMFHPNEFLFFFFWIIEFVNSGILRSRKMT